MTTISKNITLEGIGLHSGIKCKTTLMPFHKNGIHFKFGNNISEAIAEKVCDTSRCTMLDLDGHKVQTCEHLLAVIYALNINSILIEMDRDEVPTFDGSGRVWYNSLKDIITGEPTPSKTIPEPISVEDKDAYIKAYPADNFQIEYHLDYSHPMIGKSDFIYTPDKFEKYISCSRTFALYEEVEFLRQQGLAKGGNEENCIVVFHDKLSTPLRHENEFATHKILDLLGDLSLCGESLKINIIAHKSGHKLNNIFAKEIRKVMQHA